VAKSPEARTGRTLRRSLHRVCTVLLLVMATTCVAAVSVGVFWLHLGIRPVLTGSMRPTYGPGWAIVTRPIPVSSVRPGDIIVFSPPGMTVQFAHRVMTVSGSPSHPIVTTKGDANRSPDPWHARLEGRTVPEVVTEVPWVGNLMVAVKQQWARVLLIAIVGLGTCCMGTRAILGKPSSKIALPGGGNLPRKRTQPIAI
jgi:signal peptidase I